jgi:addiction module HigA family antidote
MTSRSSITTNRKSHASASRLPPVHPGEVLLEEFLKPMAISQYRLARDISVPPRRINEVVLRKRGITADTALRLARYFGTSEQFWLNLQTEYDLDVERDRLGDRLVAEVAIFRTPSAAKSKRNTAATTPRRISAMRRAQ